MFKKNISSFKRGVTIIMIIIIMVESIKSRGYCNCCFYLQLDYYLMQCETIHQLSIIIKYLRSKLCYCYESANLHRFSLNPVVFYSFKIITIQQEFFDQKDLILLISFQESVLACELFEKSKNLQNSIKRIKHFSKFSCKAENSFEIF